MNKKSQFFIIGILIFSMALTSIVYLLNIPVELSKKSIQSQTMDYSDFYSLLTDLKHLSDSIDYYWPNNYHEQSMIFSVKNLGLYDSSSQEFIINLEINDSAMLESFYLSSKKEEPEFSIIKIGEKNYLLNYNDDLSINENKEYSLLYSKLGDNNTYFRQARKSSNYYEDGLSITYESNNYAVNVNKLTGEISSLKLLGTDYETINSLGAKVNSSFQSLCASAYNFMNYANNVLVINFTCTLDSVALTQVYSFAPKFFSVFQNFEITNPGDYNLSYYADSKFSSIITEQGLNESLSEPEFIKYDSRYASTFGLDKGVLFINKGLDLYVNSPTVKLDFRISQETFTPGNYTHSVVVMPYYNNYTYSVITAKNYLINPVNKVLISKEEFLSKFKISSSSILANNFNVMSFNVSSNINDEIFSSISKEASYSLAQFSLKNSPLLNKTLVDGSNNHLSFSYNTKNYARNSSIPVSFCNNESLNITNTTFELMKITGSELLIFINTTAVINATLYDYYWQSLDNELILDNSNLSANNELNGVYRVVIVGQNACFSIFANTPLLSVKSPMIINSSADAQLFYNSKDSFIIDKTNIEGQSNIILSNSLATLINESNDFSQAITADYASPINYYLNVSAGTFYFSNSLNLGVEESYLTTNYDVSGFILKDFESTEYYRLNNSLTSQYCVMNYSANALNNTDYSIDFENQDLIINNINWSSSANLFIIDDSAFNYSGMILDTALVKSFEFYSENASMILNLVNDSKLFFLDFEKVKKDFELRINIRIRGDSDNYYLLNSKQSYFETSSYTNSKSLIKGYNVFAKNDSGTYFAVIFEADDLMQASNALTAHNDYLKLHLSKNTERVYLYFTTDYYDLLRIVNGINNKPKVSNEILIYDYSFISQNYKSNGTILG